MSFCVICNKTENTEKFIYLNSSVFHLNKQLSYSSVLNCQLLPGLNCGEEPCYSTHPLLVNAWEGDDSGWNHTGCRSGGDGNATCGREGFVLWVPWEDLVVLKGPCSCLTLHCLCLRAHLSLCFSSAPTNWAEHPHFWQVPEPVKAQEPSTSWSFHVWYLQACFFKIKETDYSTGPKIYKSTWEQVKL